MVIWKASRIIQIVVAKPHITSLPPGKLTRDLNIYFFAARIFAHRARCAAAILLRPCPGCQLDAGIVLIGSVNLRESAGRGFENVSGLAIMSDGIRTRTGLAEVSVAGGAICRRND
jgi:hypothetical protein